MKGQIQYTPVFCFLLSTVHLFRENIAAQGRSGLTARKIIPATYPRPKMGGDILTALQVSRATGISPNTVYAHLRRGYLKGVQPGAGERWYIRPIDCIEWAQICFNAGGITMRPPDYIRGFIEAFHSGELH